MSVGVMEDYKLRDLRASHTLVGRISGDYKKNKNKFLKLKNKNISCVVKCVVK